MDYASGMLNRFPDLRRTMEDVRILPLFRDFMVHNGNIYLIIFDVEGRDRTEMIRIDEATADLRYIDIPLEL